MFQFLANKAIHCLTAVLLLLATDIIWAASLSIDEAGLLALRGDYTLRAIEARGRSMSETQMSYSPSGFTMVTASRRPSGETLIELS